MRWRAFLFRGWVQKIALGYTWVTPEKEVAGYPQYSNLYGTNVKLPLGQSMEFNTQVGSSKVDTRPLLNDYQRLL